MYMQASTYQQVNHYYPYGGVMGESTGGDIQKYKYNGKRLERNHGLDWYDYGARHYDAAIVSWPTMDPLAEKYYSLSPYAYCGDNPINAIDPRGDTIRPSYIGLGHEMGHAEMSRQGLSNLAKADVNSPYPELQNITMDEYNAMRYENQIRKELEIPLRAAYSVLPNGDFFMPIK